MAKDYTAVPLEYLDEMQDLTDEEFGRLMRILLTYSQTGEVISPSGNEKYFVRRVFNREDRYNQKFDEISEKRRRSGIIGSEKRWGNSDSNATNDDSKNSKATDDDSKNSKPILLDGKNGYTNTKANTNTNTYTPPKSPPGENGFAMFWAEYPKKVGKQAAYKTWSKLNPSDELTQTIIKAVEYQRSSEQWQKNGGQYIPNPATWLNQGRWEDEVTVSTSTTPSQPSRKAQPVPADYGMAGTTVDTGDIDWLLREGLV